MSSKPMPPGITGHHKTDHALSLLVVKIVHAVVEHPDQVKIEAFSTQSQYMLRIHVHAEDVGRIIGRRGATIESLRCVTAGAGAKRYRLIRVEIGEPLSGA